MGYSITIYGDSHKAMIRKLTELFSPLVLVLLTGLVIGRFGLYVIQNYTEPLVYSGYPAIVLSLIVIAGSLLVIYLKPKVDDSFILTGSSLVTSAKPSVVVPVAYLLIGGLLGAISIWGLTNQSIPLFYPLLGILIGLYAYVHGVGLIWRNSLTRYYLTEDDFLFMYRFLGEQTTETPLEQIADIDTSRNFIQRQLDVGDVVVHSESGGGTPSIRARSVGSPRELKQQISEQRRVAKTQDHGPSDNKSSSSATDSADQEDQQTSTSNDSEVSIDQLITEITTLSADININDLPAEVLVELSKHDIDDLSEELIKDVIEDKVCEPGEDSSDESSDQASTKQSHSD